VLRGKLYEPDPRETPSMLHYIQIPKGVMEGEFRTGSFCFGRGTTVGIIDIVIKEHDIFRREGNDLFIKEPLEKIFFQRYLQIPVIDGLTRRFKAGFGKQEGRLVTVPHYGLPQTEGRHFYGHHMQERGNMYFYINKIPEK